ncbi:hypothetical protein [Crossiella cryophila]|uniref:Uncharacterized protein n=1 Tax=Crossiella cryophila TaxID=43355 RepID=A0A7W7CDP6_9PSEU|nr:hypothetical protein [Crossiella cryophila]MBB4679215.1 hypothetical protein [Crossiella cryophila]
MPNGSGVLERLRQARVRHAGERERASARRSGPGVQAVSHTGHAVLPSAAVLRTAGTRVARPRRHLQCWERQWGSS